MLKVVWDLSELWDGGGGRASVGGSFVKVYWALE